jgi:uncharacterized SAM-binding protein YcdF (DUF218 family)
MKNRISKNVFLYLILLGLVLILLPFFHQTILIEAGRYLTPEGTGEADVVILEGAESVEEDAAKDAVRLLSSERANRLVVVHQNSENGKNFDRPLNYNFLLTQKLENLGLKQNQIKVLEVPSRHPITLTEAKIVLSNLSESGLRSAILMSEGFHTRRSFWTYKQVGSKLDIKIIPYPFFVWYRNETWWHQVDGFHEFFDECLKFFYYILRGYIPMKSLFVT